MRRRGRKNMLSDTHFYILMRHAYAFSWTRVKFKWNYY